MCFPDPISNNEHQEFGATLAPRFDANGLVTAVAVSAQSQQVLMVAHMNADALRATIETGFATYWSRSRQTLWMKGETSGERQRIVSIRTDCDQDAFVLEVNVEGAGSACHNGFESCFYRQIDAQGDTVTLKTVAQPVVSREVLYAPKTED